MQTLRYNKNELSEHYAECKILKDLVTRLENNAQLEGKVVCSIRLNGMPLSEEDELRFAETLIDEIEDLEVQIESTNKLVAETLISLRDSLVKLQDRTLQVADLVRENPVGRAQIDFSSLMEQTRYLTEALATLKYRARLNQNTIPIWTSAETNTKKMIRELLTAFSTQDFVTVGDILEYELYSLLGQWVEVIDDCDFD